MHCKLSNHACRGSSSVPSLGHAPGSGTSCASCKPAVSKLRAGVQAPETERLVVHGAVKDHRERCKVSVAWNAPRSPDRVTVRPQPTHHLRTFSKNNSTSFFPSQRVTSVGSWLASSHLSFPSLQGHGKEASTSDSARQRKPTNQPTATPQLHGCHPIPSSASAAHPTPK
jgi:hypothetical protein